jgi:hypothetical protein
MENELVAMLEALTLAEDERLDALREQRPVRLRYAYEDLPEFRALQSSGRKRLERYEAALQFLFQRRGVKLGHLQHDFRKEVRLAGIKRMFGEELLENYAWLHARFGMASFDQAVCILFPRRSGKTTVQCIDAACTAVSQPDGNVVSFNLTGRQSSAWLKQCMGYLKLFKGSAEFDWTVVDRKLPERITIRARCAGTDNTISAYPGAQAGSFDNLRGMGFKLCKLYLDEGAFFDERGIPVMLPLLANGAALIVTSSIAPGGARTGAMRLLDAKDGDGRAVVRELNWIKACSACVQKGAADQCTHRVQRPQHFQSHAGQEFLHDLMKPFEGSYEREMLNQYDKPLIEPAFLPQTMVERLRDRTRDADIAAQQHNVVYVSLDPHGEGMSDATLVSALSMRMPGKGDAACLVVRYAHSRDAVPAERRYLFIENPGGKAHP